MAKTPGEITDADTSRGPMVLLAIMVVAVAVGWFWVGPGSDEPIPDDGKIELVLAVGATPDPDDPTRVICRQFIGQDADGGFCKCS